MAFWKSAVTGTAGIERASGEGAVGLKQTLSSLPDEETALDKLNGLVKLASKWKKALELNLCLTPKFMSLLHDGVTQDIQVISDSSTLQAVSI